MARSVIFNFQGYRKFFLSIRPVFRLVFSLVLVLAFASPFSVNAQEGTPDGAPSDVSYATATAGQLIISEFRVRGPNGANDEFIEIYNASGADHIVQSSSGTGYGVAASDGVTRLTIPNGVVIPKGGFYLGVNSVGYSLASYAAGNGTTATGDAAYTTDIADNAGIAIFNNNSGGASYNLANRLDAVGSTAEANTLYKEGSGYPSLTPFSINYSFYRDLLGGSPKDTNNNATDFLFVDTNGTSAGAGQRLGAPGPENLSSPAHMALAGNIAISLIDETVSLSSPPNMVRDNTSDPANNSTFGTLSIRRKITNISGQNITRLRLRITDITAFPSPSGTADLRARTSTAVVVTTSSGNVTVQGTTLEQPPSQANGGGFNSSLNVGVVTLGTPLAPGASVNVQFLFGIQQTGCERIMMDYPIVWNSCSGASITSSTLTCDSFTAEGYAFPTDGYAAMRVWNETQSFLPLIDSYINNGTPVAYAKISPLGFYTITATFPFQPNGDMLRARIYRSPSNTYSSWDGGAFQDVFFTCNRSRYFLPQIAR